MVDNLEDVLRDLGDTAVGETTTVGDVLAAFENRSMGVLLTLFGALASIPLIGGIPGASIAIGVLVIATVMQTVFGNDGLWAPDFLREKSIDSEKIDGAVEKALPWAKRIDGVLKHRLSFLIDGRAARIAVVVCTVILALAFFPLALVPWGVQVPALAILAFGLALIGKDGLVALVGYALAFATMGIGWFAF